MFAQQVEGPVLVLQDTTEFSFRRNRPEAIGAIGYSPTKRGEDGRFRLHSVWAAEAQHSCDHP